MLNPFNHIDIRVNDMGTVLPFYTSFLRALSFSGPHHRRRTGRPYLGIFPTIIRKTTVSVCWLNGGASFINQI